MSDEPTYAIRFGLGAIKAVGFGIMEKAVEERSASGKFKDIYDFASRIDAKSVNKKSVEALAKSGAFECVVKNRRQVCESFEILSNFANEKKELATSNQMSLFGGIIEESAPKLKDVPDWNQQEKLQKEFEAFGFFLNEHPLDEYLFELKKRGAVFSDKIERDEFEDNVLVKMAGVVAGSKHRSGPRGRFAYLTISDPLGMFEAMIFDEEIITNARDLLVDGSVIALECLVKKDEGGIRILVRNVKKLDDFIKYTIAKAEPFEDIQKQKQRQFRRDDGQAKSGEAVAGAKPQNKEYVKKEWPKKDYPKKDSGAEFQALRMVELRNKIIFSQIKIVINNREAILSIKPFLSQKLAPENFENTTKVFLVVDKNEVSLPQKYLLDEADISRIRMVRGIEKIET